MNSISLLAPVFAGLLLIGVTFYIFSLKRSLLKTQAQQASLIDALSKEVQGACHGSIGVGRKALQLEKQMLKLEERLEEMQNNDPAKVSYSEASRLVELGAGVEDLMNTCGISRPEAELVSALTSSKKTGDAIPVLTTEA
ncbi:MAG: DUF2802 domain-containing protein [Oleiphilus sp.]|nr:MAG: DUF2802 domain-containing protein [Oleiphilus sp.]